MPGLFWHLCFLKDVYTLHQLFLSPWVPSLLGSGCDGAGLTDKAAMVSVSPPSHWLCLPYHPLQHGAMAGGCRYWTRECSQTCLWPVLGHSLSFSTLLGTQHLSDQGRWYTQALVGCVFCDLRPIIVSLSPFIILAVKTGWCSQDYIYHRTIASLLGPSTKVCFSKWSYKLEANTQL